MANHRAPKHSASRSGSTDGSSPAASPARVGGKRKAVKPSKAARTLPRRTQTPKSAPAATPVAARVAQPPVPAAEQPLRSAQPRETEPPRRRAEPPVRATEPPRRRAEPPVRATEPPRRRAEQPVRATAKPTPAPPASAPTAAKRAPSPARPTKTTPAPSRKPVAGRSHSGTRKGLFPLLPSAPTAVGAAALVIAAAGALTVADSGGGLAAAGSSKMFTPASALSGTSAATSSLELDNRMQAVSRDSQRSALEDAADDDLQEAVEAQAAERNAALAQLAASAERYAGEIRANAWRLPLSGYRLTAGFGETSSLWSSTHTGLDFAAPYGTPALAIANGIVRSAAYDGSYGNKVVLALEDGTEIWYCHLSSFSVSGGETVNGGEQLGGVGSTGNTTGDHLHIEVRPGAGDPVDPYAAFVAHGLQP